MTASAQLRIGETGGIVDLTGDDAHTVAAMLDAAAAALEQMPINVMNAMEVVIRARHTRVARAAAEQIRGHLPDVAPRDDVQVGWWCWTCADLVVDVDCGWGCDPSDSEEHEIVPIYAAPSKTRRDTWRIETITDPHARI